VPPADGYTLLGTTGTDLLSAPFTVASAKYSPSDFRLLGVTGISDFVLASSPALDFKSVDDLIKFAKTPGNRQLSIAHWGNFSQAA
jgi:tripartite-type tricarboxylate transporter receptor subunit TctC